MKLGTAVFICNQFTWLKELQKIALIQVCCVYEYPDKFTLKAVYLISFAYFSLDILDETAGLIAKEDLIYSNIF